MPQLNKPNSAIEKMSLRLEELRASAMAVRGDRPLHRDETFAAVIRRDSPAWPIGQLWHGICTPAHSTGACGATTMKQPVDTDYP